MWTFRLMFESISPWDYVRLDQSRHPHDRIHNCQVIHYTRINPRDPDDIRSYFAWATSVCPWDMSLSSNEVREIARPRHTVASLRDVVAEHQKLFARYDL